MGSNPAQLIPDMMDTITIPGAVTQAESICVDRMTTEIVRELGIYVEAGTQTARLQPPEARKYEPD